MPAAAIQPATAPREAGGGLRSSGKSRLILSLLLVVVTLALYNPVSRNGFVNFDDDRYVTDNPMVRAGLRGSPVPWAFTSFDQANWHPLTWLSHALDCQLFQLNPVGHHYTSLLLHAVNVVLLFLVLQWFTGYTGRSLMVAALFAVHPINVESVAWVAERKNVLSMFFLLLALAAYGWYVRKPGAPRYLMVAVLFAMGLMSKPMVVTLPALLLLLDYWPLGRVAFPKSIGARHDADPRIVSSVQPLWKLCVEKVPLLALSAGSAIITMMAQKAGGAVHNGAAHDPVLRIENAVVCYALYVKKLVWPSNLAALYPYPHAMPAWKVLAAALFLLAVTGVALKYRERRYAMAGWLWFLGTMVPMSGMVQVGNQAMADRYAYLPIIGLFVMIVWALGEWMAAHALSGKLATAAAIGVLLALSAATHAQIGYWHDDLALWSRALAVTQDSFVAENNFGSSLTRQGRYDEAVVHFRAAAALEPGDSASQLNLGIYAQQHGDLQQAAARYSNVLLLATDTRMRASAYMNLGTVYFTLRDYVQAQQSFDSAIKLGHSPAVAFLDLGLIADRTAQSKEDWDRAAGYFERLVSVEPSDVGYLLLANALHWAGREEGASRAYREAQRISLDIVQAQKKAAELAAK
jgi:tetratricopeptide (TPR) repeat protein